MGMAEGLKIPAFAGMTEGDAGMTDLVETAQGDPSLSFRMTEGECFFILRNSS